MEKADDEDHGYRQKDKAYRFEWDQFLKFHVVFIDLVAVGFLQADLLVQLVDFVDQVVDECSFIFVGDRGQIGELSGDGCTYRPW